MIDNYPFVAKRRLDQVYKGRGLRSWHRKLKRKTVHLLKVRMVKEKKKYKIVTLKSRYDDEFRAALKVHLRFKIRHVSMVIFL